MKKNILLSLLCIVLFAILGGLLWREDQVDLERSEYYKQLAKEDQQKQLEEEKKYALVISDLNVDTETELPGTIVFSTDDAIQNQESDTYINTIVSIDTSIECSESDQLLIYFKASSIEKSSSLSVKAYSNDQRVLTTSCIIQPQSTEFFLPITGVTNLTNITFRIPDKIGGKIESIQIANVGNEILPAKYYGSYVECNTEDISYDTGLPIKNVQDMVASDKYLFAGDVNTLYICSFDDEGAPVVISELSGFGSIRRMELSKDNNILIIACREYGVFVVDISDLNKPTIRSHIDTLELASGIDLVDNTLFIASRYYGLEIYDITDPGNPVFCSAVKSNEESECIDCVAYGDYLYASVWATQRVEIFDIKDISTPKYIGYIETDGNAYGADICNGNLVVATGFHSRINDSSNEQASGYATGNGISVYSLENPVSPKLCSQAKADGRYYYIGSDYWNVKVSGDYAYFADLYNGLLIYDLKNPYSPVRIEKYIVPIPNTSDKYVDFTNKGAVFAFDPAQEVYSPISAVAIRDGYVYFADHYSAIHTDSLNEATIKNDQRTVASASGEDCYQNSDYGNYSTDVERHKVKGQAYSIDEYENKLYIGTSKGIQICDKDMNELAFLETKAAVRDLRIVDGKVYTAQEIDGVHIYDIDEISLTEIGHYIPSEINRINTCYQIGVSPDGKYIITTGRLNMMMLLDASDMDNIVVAEYLKCGAVYYRNIIDDLVANTLYITHPAGVSEIIFNDDGSYEYNELPNSTYFYSSGGFAAYDDQTIFAICNTGIQVLDVANGFGNVQEGDFNSYNPIRLKGSPAINKSNKLMCVSFPAKGQITILNAKDPNKIQLLADLYIKGNADNAYISDDGIVFVPCRYEGVLKITVNLDE